MGSRRPNDASLLPERVRTKLGALLGSAAARTSEGAGRLREAARDLRQGQSLLSQALAARERGNLEAAFFLLEEAWRTEPAADGVPTAFWDVALSLGRAEAAAAAAVSLVERCADEGADELGAQYLAELAEAESEALVKPVAIVRLLPALRERVEKARDEQRSDAEALLQHALALALHPRNESPSPGLALRLFAEARVVDPDAARRAAELALASPDLHEAKRAMLCEFLGRVPKPRPDEGRTEPPRAEPSAPDHGSRAGGDRSEEPAAPEREPEPARRPQQPSVRHAPSEAQRRLHGVPEELNDAVLVVRREGGHLSRIGWGEIEAVAVARIEADGRESVTVVDLVFNWTRRDGEALRLLRLRDDAFDPARFVSSGEDPLAGFLGLILERSHAIPLPDPESALGLRPVVFDSLDAYEHALLGRSRA